MKRSLASKSVIGALLSVVLLLGCSGLNIGASKKALQLVEIDIAGPDTLNVGDVQQYTATGVFDDQSTIDLTLGVVWVSSDQTVATVDPFDFAGQVTALGPGQVTISALGDDNAVGSLTITVNDPNGQNAYVPSQNDGSPAAPSASLP